MPPPPPPYRQAPPSPLLRMRCRNMRWNAQRSVRLVTSGLKKRGTSGEYPLSIAPCAEGRVSTRRSLAWVRPQAWPASPLNQEVATKTPSPPPAPSPSSATSSTSAFTSSMSSAASSSFTPPPPAASSFFFSSLFFSFFLFFSSFFFSFFLLFLSCSEECVDSLEESAAGREAEAG